MFSFQAFRVLELMSLSLGFRVLELRVLRLRDVLSGFRTLDGGRT